MDQNNNIFSDDQKDILQEIMNIAFGNATADLANIIDIHVDLSIPDIELLVTERLPEYVAETLDTYSETFIINQKFMGDFKGTGLFIFPNNTEHDLSTILEDSQDEYGHCNSAPSLEKEMIMEIGNILIGACVGKISELLNTSVTYSPPHSIYEKNRKFDSLNNLFMPSQSVITMKTRFQQKSIKGFILVITDQESIEWLKNALDKFMENYQ